MENGTTTSSWAENETDQTLYDDMGGWPHFSLIGYSYWVVLIIVGVVGLVGNILVLVLMNDSKLSNISYTVYMRFLAISDTLVLFLKIYEESEVVFDVVNILNYDNVLCKIWNYFKHVTALLSPWLIVGFTIDRCICIVFPLQRSRFCTRNKAIATCLFLTLTAAMMLLVILIRVEVIDGYCRAPLSLYTYYIVIRLAISSLVPCIFILIPTLIMIIRIQRSANFRKSFSSTSSTNQQRDKSTRPLMLVSVFAFIALLPLAIAECVEVLLILSGTNQSVRILAGKLLPLCNIIYLFNFSQNFYILMMSSAKYRKIIAKKLCEFRAGSASTRQRTPSASASKTSQLGTSVDVLPSISNLVND